MADVNFLKELKEMDCDVITQAQQKTVKSKLSSNTDVEISSVGSCPNNYREKVEVSLQLFDIFQKNKIFIFLSGS